MAFTRFKVGRKAKGSVSGCGVNQAEETRGNVVEGAQRYRSEREITGWRGVLCVKDDLVSQGDKVSASDLL
jgi:hypothetical protein